MAYTLVGIRNRVLDDKLDDTDYDPAVVDRFINDTQRDIFNSFELPFAEKTFLGSLTAGNYIFIFPEDYQLAQSVVLTSPTDKIIDLTDYYISFREFNGRFPRPAGNPAGSPTLWTIHGNKMYFDRPTDQEYQLTMFYIKKPILLTDDAHIPELPEEFEELLVLGAYYRVLERNEDYDLAAAQEQKYLRGIDKMNQRLGKRQTGTPSIMPQPRASGAPRSRRRP